MSWRRGTRPNRTIWRPLRLAVLNAQNWTCQRCGGWGNNCDHVKPLEDGGALYDLGNLQTLCKGCHIAKTKRENQHQPTPELDAWAARLTVIQQ